MLRKPLIPFVGREEELEALSLLMSKKTPSIAVIRGRRRIGKSRLVEEFAKDKNFYQFSGIPPTDHVTAQSQRDVFVGQMGMAGVSVSDWADVFTLLSKHIKPGPSVILLDEISWMGSKDPTFLGKLKNAWDITLSKIPGLILILCGSISTWIEQNILKSTGFFGRISLSLTLAELPLKDCNALLQATGFNGSFYEKFKILSVTGGIPWYLEQIHPQLNADENIKSLCFRKNGVLVDEFDLIFHDLFSKRNPIYKKIIEALSDGPLEFNDIVNTIDYSISGVLSEYLNDLKSAGYISRDFTWNVKTTQESRLSHFRLSDNYLRFYLKYIAMHKGKIARDGFKDRNIMSFPGWDTIMGYQFENLVLRNRYEVLKALHIRSEDVVVDNPFFQRKTAQHNGCQIDYLIQTRHQVLFACEVKFSRQEITTQVIQAMKDKLNRFVRPKGFACRPVLIHASDVSEPLRESQYFELVDFRDLL